MASRGFTVLAAGGLAAISIVVCQRAIGSTEKKQAEEDRDVVVRQLDAGFETAPTIDVPSDPKAKYVVIDEGGTPNLRTLTTRRVGSSGTSFARREFDCRKRTVRYLATGDTLEAMTPVNEKMSSLVAGSIADVMWHRACANRAVEEK